MKKNKFNLELTDQQLDTLKELGNIGSGNAVTAISQLLEKEIDMSLTFVNILPFWQVSTIIENPNEEVFAISSNIKGKESMAILQFFPKKSILNIIKNLSQSKITKINTIKRLEDLDAYSLSIISEFGNILAGHYASSMASLLEIKLLPRSPLIVLDSFEAILNTIIGFFTNLVDSLIVIKTKIEIKNLDLEGILCFIPDLECMNNFFKILNIKYNVNIL